MRQNLRPPCPASFGHNSYQTGVKQKLQAEVSSQGTNRDNTYTSYQNESAWLEQNHIRMDVIRVDQGNRRGGRRERERK